MEAVRATRNRPRHGMLESSFCSPGGFCVREEREVVTPAEGASFFALFLTKKEFTVLEYLSGVGAHIDVFGVLQDHFAGPVQEESDSTRKKRRLSGCPVMKSQLLVLILPELELEAFSFRPISK